MRVSGDLRLPHVGWNTVEVHRTSGLFEGFDEAPICYFNHSFGLFEANRSAIAAISHGETITAAIQHENIFGVQFHPERSQMSGLRILENFLRHI